MENKGSSIRGVDLRKDYGDLTTPAEVRNMADQYDCSNLSPLKDDPIGVDWLFAGTTLVESYMIANKGIKPDSELLPCSEYHALQALYEIDAKSHENTWGLDPNQFGYFGNRQYMLSYLTRGDGAVAALSDPNTQQIEARARTLTDRKPQCYLATEARFIPDPYVFPDPRHQFALKMALQTYGPVAALMYYDPAMYGKESGGQWCYFCDTKQLDPPEQRELIYHSVVIVGWSDTFDKANFKTTPKENGAFKVRDCNKTDRSDMECFWVSYEDVEFGHDAWCLTAARTDFFEKVRKIYQQDLFGFGAVYPCGPALTNDISGKNRFKRDKSRTEEYLEQIGFYVAAPCRCLFYLTQGTKSETQLNTKPGDLYTEPGYYTYTLSSAQKLTEDHFDIRVQFVGIDSRSAVFVPLEKKDERTQNHLKITASESWVDTTDVLTLDPKFALGHVCIKALTADRSADATTLNTSAANTSIPTENHGILPELQTIDGTVSLDWSLIEPGSEGDLKSFIFGKVATKRLWSNDTDTARRLVLTLELSLGNHKLRKLVSIKLSARQQWSSTASKVPDGTISCSFGGKFPMDGIRAKVSARNKTKTSAPVVYGQKAQYPIVNSGEWKNPNFWLVSSSEYDSAHCVYCLQADLLDDDEKVVAKSEVREATIDKLFEKKNGVITSASIIGLMIAMGLIGAGAYSLSMSCGCVTVAADGALFSSLLRVPPGATVNGGGNTINLGDGSNLPDIEIEGKVSDLIIKRRIGGGLGVTIGTGITVLSGFGLITKCEVEITIDSQTPAAVNIAPIAGSCEGQIKDCKVTIISKTNVAQLAGVTLTNKSTGKITGCKITGNIIGSQVGGIALVNEGEISGCTVTADISSSTLAGGIAATATSGKLTANSFEGKLTGEVCGGIAGRLTSGEISECAAAVVADKVKTACGGIVGEAKGGTIADCYSVGILTSSGKAGGIAGSMTGAKVRRCYSIATLNPSSSSGTAGGIAGTTDDKAIENCVAANTYIGGQHFYRTADGELGTGCVALEQAQPPSGQSFPKTKEKLVQLAQITTDTLYKSLGWQISNIWNMDDAGMTPKLKNLASNPTIRHPFFTIATQATGGIYKFKDGDEVKFSGMKNTLVKRIEWELASGNATKNRLTALRADTPAWEESIGYLVKGSYLVTLYAAGDGFKLTYPPIKVVVE